MTIAIIKDSDLGIGLKDKPLNNPITRYASRGILLNQEGKIGLFHKALKHEYKLPGGGMDGDDPVTAFKREMMEETGCEVEIIQKLGTIEEHKGQTNFKQISHVYVARVTKDTHTLHLTEKEKAEGAEFLWATLDEAITLIHDSFDKLVASSAKVKNGAESVYMTQFVIKRDEAILQYYKNLLLSQSKKISNNK